MDKFSVIHQRPGVVDPSGIKSSDEGAPDYLQQQDSHSEADEVPEFCIDLLFLRIDQVQRHPEGVGEGDEGGDQVHCQAVVAHCGNINQPALHHIPAQEALKATEEKKDQRLFDGGAGELFGEQKIQEG